MFHFQLVIHSVCVLMINIPLGIHACEDVDQWLREKPNLISLLMNLYFKNFLMVYLHYIWSFETMIDIVHVLGKNM